MKTPFEILDIDVSASDSEIKSAYLKKVRQFTPEQFPEEFKKIKEAYNAIGNSKKRIEFALFNVDEPDMNALIVSTIKSRKKRIDSETFYLMLSKLAEEEIKHIP